MLTSSGIYPWSFVTPIFRNGQASHGVCVCVCVCVCVPIGNDSEIELMSKANIYAYPSGAPEFNAGF